MVALVTRALYSRHMETIEMICEYGIGGYDDGVKWMPSQKEAAEELSDINRWTDLEGMHLVVRDVSPWRPLESA